MAIIRLKVVGKLAAATHRKFFCALANKNKSSGIQAFIFNVYWHLIWFCDYHYRVFYMAILMAESCYL